MGSDFLPSTPTDPCPLNTIAPKAAFSWSTSAAPLFTTAFFALYRSGLAASRARPVR